MDHLDHALIEKFNLESFRPGQKEAITSLLNGEDVLAVMPTGGGKSLCYQLPAFVKEGLAIVISPLIALMNDQVQSLQARGLKAGCIHSGLSNEEKKKVFQQMKEEKSFVLYLSPERTQKPGFLNWLKSQKVSLFAIDEAHCVSQWGHDFRPDYARISELREILPDVPMMALTATATPLVKKDIIKQLKLKKPSQHVHGFYRPNLYYQVEFCDHEADKESFVLGALNQTPKGRVIIYCGTRKKAEAWSETLNRLSYSVGYYHAGLSAESRSQVEEDYKSGKIRILAATNAFGMGIDHPDVRLVVHTQIPGNIESYYQEIGRAGRDGKDSTCLLVYSKKDKGLQSFFITQADAEPSIKSLRWAALDAMVHYAEGSECRHGDILTYFKDTNRIQRCGHCESCDPKSERRVQPIKSPLISLDVKKKKKKKPLESFQFNDHENLMVEKIRGWRKDYAKKRDVPAFMVFSDKTLKDIVMKKPKTESDLEEIYGLGAKKVDLFGESLLQELQAF